MPSLLSWLAAQRPWHIFSAALLTSFVGAAFNASTNHPVLTALGSLLGVLLLFGYPLLIIFGFPEPYSTLVRRRIALAGAVLLLVALLAVSLGAPQSRPEMPDWLGAVLGFPFVILLYAPFFIATSVIDDARRALGKYKPLDCIITWLCVVTYPALGVFFIQRTVAPVLTDLGESRTSRSSTA